MASVGYVTLVVERMRMAERGQQNKMKLNRKTLLPKAKIKCYLMC